MARKLIFTIVFIIGEFMDLIQSDNINHDCSATVSATTDVATELLNITGYCDLLFRTEESRFFQASFERLDPGYFVSADFIKIYDGDSRGEQIINLDIADGDVVNTNMFSKGSVLLVSISRKLDRRFEVNITTFDQRYVEINTSQYDGIVKSPRYTQRRKAGDKIVMIKNLKYSCRLTPVLGSSLSLNFSEIDIGDEIIQILPSNHTISSSSKKSTLRYNITSEEVSVLLDSFPNRFPRGEGFSMAFEVCGGTSNESQANVSLPTPMFFGFDKSLKCSYVYTCPSGYVPFLTLTMRWDSKSKISSKVEIYMDDELLIPMTSIHFQNFSASYVGNGSKIALLLHHSSSNSLMHPVVFANFSSKKLDITDERKEGETYARLLIRGYLGIVVLFLVICG